MKNKEELSNLKSNNYESYINGGVDTPLIETLEGLSEIITLNNNNSLSGKEVKTKISELGDFANGLNEDNDDITEALSSLYQDLISMKSSTESFVTDTINNSSYINDNDKAVYESLIREASSKEELSNISHDISESITNNELMIKTLSAIRNGVENASDLDKGIQKELFEKIDEIGIDYHETGELNVGVLNTLINEVKSTTDKDGNRLISIDKEDDVDSIITQKVNTEFIDSVYSSINNNINEILSSSDKVTDVTKDKFKSGEITISELQKILEKESSSNFEYINNIIESQTKKDHLLNKEISRHYDTQIQRLSESSRLELSSLKEVYLKGEISKEDFTDSLYNVMSSVPNSAEEIERLIDINEEMKQSMTVLENNTNSETNELSTKEKLINQNKLELEAENNKMLQDALGGLDVKENKVAKGSVLSGTSSVEDLGEKAGDGIMDLIASATGMDFLSSDSDSLLDMGIDKGKEKWDNRKKGHSKRGSSRSKGGSKGIFGAMKGLVGGGTKSAIGGATSAGKGLLGSAGGLMKSVGTKALGPLAGLASAGMAGYDFFTAEDSAEKKTALGSGVGGLIGGALGAIGGPLGIAAGAAVGNWVGGKIGGLFTDPDDYIPDSIKDQGPVEEIRYIDNGLMPEVIASAESGNGDYDADDAQSLREYRKELMDDGVEDYIENIINTNGADEESDNKKLELIDKKLSTLKTDSPKIYNEVMTKAKEMYPNGDGKEKGIMESAGGALSDVGSNISSFFGFGEDDKKDTKKAKEENSKDLSNTNIALDNSDDEGGFFSNTWSSLFGGSEDKSEEEKDLANAEAQQGISGISVSDNEQQQIDYYTQQGMNNPAQISMATGIPVGKITTGMGGNQSSQFQNSNGNINMDGVAKSSDQQPPAGGNTTVIQSSTSGDGGSSSSMRVSDQSVNILAQMV